MSSTEALSESQLQAVRACEQRLGYTFSNPKFLYEAITHASVANSRLLSYERLEFLGDSILGFTVCEYLFNQYPEWLEGELTQIKSNVVSRDSCAEIGRDLKIEDCLVVGKGVGSRGKVPKSLLANAFESIVAAIYLDGGMEVVKKFLLPLVIPKVEDSVNGECFSNYKAELQQYAQKRYGFPPVYELVESRGPDHEKWFKISARVHRKTFEPSWGKNKKQAEQRAAANALASIHGEEPPFPCEDD